MSEKYPRHSSFQDAGKNTVDPFYSKQNQLRLRKSIAEMEATGGTIHDVSSVTDSLIGLLQDKDDLEDARSEVLVQRYSSIS